jgi:hypothetical protein
MPVPQRVPVAREAGYHTDTIGRYRDGQFYAAVLDAHRDDDRAQDRGRERVRWYAYPPLLDADGNHRESGPSSTPTGWGSATHGTAPTAHEPPSSRTHHQARCRDNCLVGTV